MIPASRVAMGGDGGADSRVVVIDSAVDTISVPSKMGEGCQSRADCSPDAPVCILYDRDGGRGICSVACTPDDPATELLNEDSCSRSKGFVCGSFGNDNTSNYCVKVCTPSLTANPCPASSGQTCAPNSTRYTDIDTTVCWEAACRNDKECPVVSAKQCATDAECQSLLSDNSAFCVGRRCALPGKCSQGGICAPHTHGKAGASVEDPCTSSFDCPNGAICLTDGDGFPNGYCSITGCASGILEFACPQGSTCHRLFFGGLCHLSCEQDDATSCRGQAADRGGDYECYAWNNLTIGGEAVSLTPVCAPTRNQGCDSLGSTIDCSVLATEPSNNSQHMGCRSRETGAVLTDIRDPSGFCMDDTASGLFGPRPDGGLDMGSDMARDMMAGDAPRDAGADAAQDSSAPADLGADQSAD